MLHRGQKMKLQNELIGFAVSEETQLASICSARDDCPRGWDIHETPLLSLRDPTTKQVVIPRGTLCRSDDNIIFRIESERTVEMTIGLCGGSITVNVTEKCPPVGSLPERMRACLSIHPLQILPGLFALDPSEENSGFVLPLMEGVWLPSSDLDEYAMLKLHYVMGLSMGFWGACRPGLGSITAICDHPYLQILLEGGPQGLSLKPEWLCDPDAVPLNIRFIFSPGDKPLDAAREFRRHELATKDLPGLSRRLSETPALKNLIGGANIKFQNYCHTVERTADSGQAPRPDKTTRVYRFEDVARVCRELKGMGIDRAMAIFWGWGNGGYDHLHPDILPANEWAGGDNSLRKASEEIKDVGFTVGGHDNYQDIYEAAPSFGKGESVAVNPDGSLCKGGFWSGGRCYIQCSKAQLDFARRNLADIRDRYEWNALFIDTITAAHLYECYSSNHPRSREDDRQDKITLMKEARALFGVFGSEAAQSWGAEHMDYWEGITLPPQENPVDWWASKLKGAPLPVFGAVYRDILLAYQHQSQGLHPELPGYFLASLRSAQPPYYFFQENFFPQHAAYVRKTYEVLAYLHRYTVDVVIEQHDWLTGDKLVERIILGDGTTIIINGRSRTFTAEPGLIPGLSGRNHFDLAPLGFLVQGPRMLAFWARSMNSILLEPELWAVARLDDNGRTVLFTDRLVSAETETAIMKMLPFKKS